MVAPRPQSPAGRVAETPGAALGVVLREDLRGVADDFRQLPALPPSRVQPAAIAPNVSLSKSSHATPRHPPAQLPDTQTLGGAQSAFAAHETLSCSPPHRYGAHEVADGVTQAPLPSQAPDGVTVAPAQVAEAQAVPAAYFSATAAAVAGAVEAAGGRALIWALAQRVLARRGRRRRCRPTPGMSHALQSAVQAAARRRPARKTRSCSWPQRRKPRRSAPARSSRWRCRTGWTLAQLRRAAQVALQALPGALQA